MKLYFRSVCFYWLHFRFIQFLHIRFYVNQAASVNGIQPDYKKPVLSRLTSLTMHKLMGFGRCGERLANTP